jgi:nitroreductase
MTINSTIDLMHNHVSVRWFEDQAIPADHLKAILEAGQMASTWKNFQSYSIIRLTDPDKRAKLFDLDPQRAYQTAAEILVFVGDLNRASKAVAMHGGDFQPEGVESLLITSVDASLAAQNVLVAAESLGYGGVFMGLLRTKSAEVSELLELPDYVYPLYAISLGVPHKVNAVKPRLPQEAVVFENAYQEQSEDVIRDYDENQHAYSNHRGDSMWSDRIVTQWGQAEQEETLKNLQSKGLMK